MTEQATAFQPEMALSDGRTVTIRPLADSDKAAMLEFGAGLPEEDVLYLEEDLHSPDIIARLVNASSAENWRQKVATIDGRVVGYSSVRRRSGWSGHVANIVLVVDRSCRKSGVGTMLARAIFDAAQELAVRKLVIEMLEGQVTGEAIFKRLGFTQEGLLRNHVRDRSGKMHNLRVMSYIVE